MSTCECGCGKETSHRFVRGHNAKRGNSQTKQHKDANRKGWKSVNSLSIKKSNLRKYKITYETFLEMIKDGCAICGVHDNLCVDHDHACCPGTTTCGECIRDVLCRNCNAGLGWFGDNPEKLILAAEYIRKHKND